MDQQVAVKPVRQAAHIVARRGQAAGADLALHKGQFAQHAGVGARVRQWRESDRRASASFRAQNAAGCARQAGETVGKRLRVGGVVQFVHQGDEFAMVASMLSTPAG